MQLQHAIRHASGHSNANSLQTSLGLLQSKSHYQPVNVFYSIGYSSDPNQDQATHSWETLFVNFKQGTGSVQIRKGRLCQ